jgi:hypothetical protein
MATDKQAATRQAVRILREQSRRAADDAHQRVVDEEKKIADRKAARAAKNNG